MPGTQWVTPSEAQTLIRSGQGQCHWHPQSPPHLIRLEAVVLDISSLGVGDVHVLDGRQTSGEQVLQTYAQQQHQNSSTHDETLTESVAHSKLPIIGLAQAFKPTCFVILAVNGIACLARIFGQMWHQQVAETSTTSIMLIWKPFPSEGASKSLHYNVAWHCQWPSARGGTCTLTTQHCQALAAWQSNCLALLGPPTRH